MILLNHIIIILVIILLLVTAFLMRKKIFEMISYLISFVSKEKNGGEEPCNLEEVKNGGGKKSLLKTTIKDLVKNPRSKSENSAIKIFESLIGGEMPTVNPKWLVWRGQTLELDGYNKDKRVALEFSGPQHTKWFPEKETYDIYFARVLKDIVKKRLCRKNKVTLVVLDTSLPQHHWLNYIKSRLFDAKRYDLIGISKENISAPTDYHWYIFEQTPEVFRNFELERDLGLDAELKRVKSI